MCSSNKEIEFELRTVFVLTRLSKMVLNCIVYIFTVIISVILILFQY